MVVVGWDRWRWGVGRVLINGSQGPRSGPEPQAFADFKNLIQHEIQKYIDEEVANRNRHHKLEFLGLILSELEQIWEQNRDFDPDQGFDSATLAFRQ